MGAFSEIRGKLNKRLQILYKTLNSAFSRNGNKQKGEKTNLIWTRKLFQFKLVHKPGAGHELLACSRELGLRLKDTPLLSNLASGASQPLPLHFRSNIFFTAVNAPPIEPLEVVASAVTR